MEVTYPVFVLEKDSGDIMKFESLSAVQRQLERIDVENEEYAAWDSLGHPLTLLVQDPAWLKIVSSPEGANAPHLGDSLRRYAQLRKIGLTDNEKKLGPVDLYEAISARGTEGRKFLGLFRPRK